MAGDLLRHGELDCSLGPRNAGAGDISAADVGFFQPFEPDELETHERIHIPVHERLHVGVFIAGELVFVEQVVKLRLRNRHIKFVRRVIEIDVRFAEQRLRFLELGEIHSGIRAAAADRDRDFLRIGEGDGRFALLPFVGIAEEAVLDDDVVNDAPHCVGSHRGNVAGGIDQQVQILLPVHHVAPHVFVRPQRPDTERSMHNRGIVIDAGAPDRRSRMNARESHALPLHRYFRHIRAEPGTGLLRHPVHVGAVLPHIGFFHFCHLPILLFLLAYKLEIVLTDFPFGGMLSLFARKSPSGGMLSLFARKSPSTSIAHLETVWIGRGVSTARNLRLPDSQGIVRQLLFSITQYSECRF